MELSRYVLFTSNIRIQYSSQTDTLLDHNLDKEAYTVRQTTELIRITYNISDRSTEDRGQPIETKIFSIDE